MPTGLTMLPVTTMMGMNGGGGGDMDNFESFGNPNSLGQQMNMFHQNLLMNDAHQTNYGMSLNNMHGQGNTGLETDLHHINNNNEFESKSGSENLEGVSGEDHINNDPNQPSPNNNSKKKKRYHRHTQHQIQELESFFKECPHPDDKQRKELSHSLGLEPLQVKFWFQNKRTQMKTQLERNENTLLRNENEKLRSENMRFREALANTSCPQCGGPTVIGEMSFEEQQLRLENARLRDEVDKISTIAAKYVGNGRSLNNYTPFTSPPTFPFSTESAIGGGEMLASGSSDHFIRTMMSEQSSEADKAMILELAVTSMEEFLKMSQMDEPLWMPVKSDNTSMISNSFILNEDEYHKNFHKFNGHTSSGYTIEASKDTAVVIMNHINLVQVFMDANHWKTMFCGIVSRASTHEVLLSTGVSGNFNGALLVMSAELQVATPLVPTREIYFARYCKQHSDGVWAVVDFSLDNLRPNSISSCRKRPSGCLIHETPNGYSKVTWVENVEVEDRGVHNLYKPLVSSGLAFGARRWLGTLERQCERLASFIAPYNIPINGKGVFTSEEGRRNMMKLAERMMMSFSASVSASVSHTWTTLSGTGADDVRVMARNNVDEHGRPPGIALSAATSLWVSVPPVRVFDFLRNENHRSQWDILCNGVVSEMDSIAIGRNAGNCISLLRVSGANSSQSNMLILQESCTDSTTSFVIYTPIDFGSMKSVLSGGDPDYVALLPSGFAIYPDDPTGGSLLTVAFQILVDPQPNAKLSLESVATVNQLISTTVERIKEALAVSSS